MIPFTKARGNSNYANPDDAPRHGPYAHAWWDRTTERWKLALKPQGKAMVAAFVEKYPNPAAILFSMRTPKVATVLAKRWLAMGEEKSQEAGAAAMMGVVRAAMKFDPSRGFQFATLVPYYVLSEVQDLDRRLLRSREETMVRADQSRNGYEDDGWDRLSLEDERPDRTLGLDRREEVRKVLGLLDPRSQAILKAIYLDNGKTQTLDVVGAKFGMCKERVRQIKEAAFARVREKMGEQP